MTALYAEKPICRSPLWRGLLLSTCAVLLGAPLATQGSPVNFVSTGSLATARNGHTATMLPNGKVLVAGGFDGNSILASAELYDPASGTWSATGSLATARAYHTATLLPNGKVLVAGGGNNSAELYDPASGTWSATGSLATARAYHTATLLLNGKVLIVAGEGNSAPFVLASAELYDPASGTWSATGSLAVARAGQPSGHTATLLPNGKVLVAGGGNSNSILTSAELYDPASGTWSATGSFATPRSGHTATLLSNGKVFVAGGGDGHNIFASTELYDPGSGTWSATGSFARARFGHTATLLPNGKVLVIGGGGSLGGHVFGGAELYDPASGTSSTTGSPATARENHTATLLPNGKVLVAGGFDIRFGFVFASAELYNTPVSRLYNFSTRASVQTGQGITIAGFIIAGTGSKSVVVRGLGSTLAPPPFNVPGVLADPTLQLFDGGGHPFWFNDNWKDTQETQIQSTGLAASNDLESAILQILQPGNYTAILSGKNGSTGVGLVEVYDTDTGASAELTNVSTRGFVGTGDNVLIAGFIASDSTEVVVRGLGPTLAQPQFGVSGALADPVVTLVDGNGNVVQTNDNWKNTDQAAISATGKAPPNDLEAAIFAPVSAGNYTAILSGNGGGTGIGLVEVYRLP
jgi:WD40 repeat protein